MTQIDWQQACDGFPSLLEQAEKGAEVVICRDALPVVRLTSIRSESLTALAKPACPPTETKP